MVRAQVDVVAIEPMDHQDVAPLIAQIARDRGWPLGELFRRRPALGELHAHYSQDHPGPYATCPQPHLIAPPGDG